MNAQQFILKRQQLMPQHGLSRFAGLVANNKTPWFKNWVIKRFIKHYQVDMSLAQREKAEDYACFNDFFTRHLKPDARDVVATPDALASPVDGIVSQVGNIEDGRIIQAKNQDYSLFELLGGQQDLADQFTNGRFVTIYLSPRHYHRVHMPYTGQLKEMVYVPGRLFSVNEFSTTQVPRLFARNERVISYFDTHAGPMAVVMVGAMLVASIHTVWANEISPSSQNSISRLRYSADKQTEIRLSKGNEMGHFQLGSTIVLLFGQDAVEWTANLKANQEVFMGQEIGRVNTL